MYRYKYMEQLYCRKAQQTSQRSTADLSTKNNRPLKSTAGAVCEDMPYLPCYVETSAVLSAATWPKATIPIIYLISFSWNALFETILTDKCISFSSVILTGKSYIERKTNKKSCAWCLWMNPLYMIHFYINNIWKIVSHICFLLVLISIEQNIRFCIADWDNIVT